LSAQRGQFRTEEWTVNWDGKGNGSRGCFRLHSQGAGESTSYEAARKTMAKNARRGIDRWLAPPYGEGAVGQLDSAQPKGNQPSERRRL